MLLLVNMLLRLNMPERHPGLKESNSCEHKCTHTHTQRRTETQRDTETPRDTIAPSNSMAHSKAPEPYT